jgi:uncharacterized protein (TIRG00374 family)
MGSKLLRAVAKFLRAEQNQIAMAADSTKNNRKKGVKHWIFFGLRWAVAAVGVWLVVKNMSLHDQALVILNPATNRPVMVSLASKVDETAAVYPVIDPANSSHIIAVAASNVVSAPDVKKVDRVTATGTQSVTLLGLDLGGNLVPGSTPRRLLVADDAKSGPAVWVPASQVPQYTVHVPYPKDQVGLESLVKEAKPSLLWAALLVFPVTFLITSYRWHELLKALDIHIGQSKAFVINMVGCFYNTFLPGSTGGDAFKAYYASRQTPHRTRAVMSVLVDRAVGLLALIILGGVTASLQWQIPACRKVAIGSALICFCAVVGFLLFYNPTLHRISGLDFLLKKLPMQKQVRGAVDAMRQYGKRPWLGIWSLVVSFPVHGAVVSSAMFAGMAFGLPLHWAYYWVAVPVIVLAGAIPLSPQGAGIMEGFAVLLTRTQGVTVSQAFALTMSIRMVQIIWNLVGGIFVLRGGYHAPGEGEKTELENLPPEPDAGDDTQRPRELVPA